MVRKVILIGFIGLLITLSNAMEKKTTVKEQTFKFDGTNIGPAFTASAFQHVKSTNSDVTNVTCSKYTPIYCQSKYDKVSACIKFSGFVPGDDNKPVDVTFDNSGDNHSKYFARGSLTLQCQKMDTGNTIDVASEDFEKLVQVIVESKKDAPSGTKVYCDVTLKNQEKPETKYFVPNVEEEHLKEEAKALNPFRNKKTYAFNESTQYEIKCQGVATFWQRWRTWIIILGVLAAVIGVCYWFLCCDEDDDDEGKDENKAADP